ncbi:HAD-IB family hydrolase [Actinoplanes sp. NPDC026670]|uniref:HAD family hydrolase n=1 Tax=Actinoplanes sp. NPDC026670 TaxID=3154700 RepID=UPI00340C434D
MVTAVPIAFFDVDETLVDTKSMFDFLRFHLAAQGDDGTRYAEQAGGLRRAAASGVPRSEINRAYYRLFAGESWSGLLAEGARWYAELLTRPEPFLAEGLAALRLHQAAGHLIVLVSGSFRPCLDPVAAHLGADVVLCTEPLTDGSGRLTGEVAAPMIGDNKRDAVLGLIAERRADPARCFGYGDHSSDLAFLAEVGHPTVIGRDPDLTAVAEREGWPILTATTCAA